MPTRQSVSARPAQEPGGGGHRHAHRAPGDAGSDAHRGSVPFQSVTGPPLSNPENCGVQNGSSRSLRFSLRPRPGRRVRRRDQSALAVIAGDFQLPGHDIAVEDVHSQVVPAWEGGTEACAAFLPREFRHRPAAFVTRQDHVSMSGHSVPSARRVHFFACLRNIPAAPSPDGNPAPRQHWLAVSSWPGTQKLVCHCH